MGNDIRCDDGVGPVVANLVENHLKKRDHAHVEVRTSCVGGLDLSETEGFDRLIAVDSFYTQESDPGRVRVLGPGSLLKATPVFDSAHLMSLPSALALSEERGYHTPELVGIVTIDVGESCMTFGEGLTDAVSTAAHQATREVLSLIALS